jgi:hypothetical protein
MFHVEHLPLSLERHFTRKSGKLNKKLLKFHTPVEKLWSYLTILYRVSEARLLVSQYRTRPAGTWYSMIPKMIDIMGP